MSTTAVNPKPLPVMFARFRRKLGTWRTRARDWQRGETRETFFDIHNSTELNELLARANRAPIDAIDTTLTLAENPWKAALAYQARADMREVLPLGLTPRDRGLFLLWMLQHGSGEVGFTDADALQAVFSADRDPSRGLIETFQLQPRWQQQVPHGATVFGWRELKAWLAREYGLAGRWFERAELVRRFSAWDELQLLLRAKPELARSFPHDRPQEIVRWVRQLRDVPNPGRAWRNELASAIADGIATRPRVTVLGLFRYSSGLQQAANGMVGALERVGITADLRDVPGPAIRENPTVRPLDRVEIADVTIIHTGLDTAVPDAYKRAGLAAHPGVYRIATWWWELEQLPQEWRDRGRDVDEIWAPTQFIAESLRVLGKPVFPMLPGLELPAFAPLGKTTFGMSPEKFTFVVLFDANSRLGRKNPLAAVRAFRHAFRADEPVELVVKMTPPGTTDSPDVRELREFCRDSGVLLVESVFTRNETLAFLAAADSLVSLHRSEGFGLPLAEAMLLGKPVVATNYSGNLDFMTRQNSYLVDAERTTIDVDDPPYRRGFVWAEPSVPHAALLMRRVVDHRSESRAIGARASAELRETLSWEAAGKRMRTRLEAIFAERARLPAVARLLTHEGR